MNFMKFCESLSYAELEMFSAACHEVKTARLHIRCARLPKPVIKTHLSLMENTKEYRTKHKCDLLEAHYMVRKDYYSALGY